jgi:hypothetical protein
VGDVAGVRIPPTDLVQPPTPPPDIDVEAWMRSIDLVAEHRPRFLALTHFGFVDAPGPHLDETKRALREMAELVRRLLEQHGDTEEAVRAFVDEVNRRTEERCGPEMVKAFEVGSPVEQRWGGLSRYWQKQAQEKGKAA